MKARKGDNRVYIVICTCRDVNDPYFIDSVWTSERKAEKRKNVLNSGEMESLRDDCGYLAFEVISKAVLK